jgi:hypothetical protein
MRINGVRCTPGHGLGTAVQMRTGSISKAANSLIACCHSTSVTVGT